MYVLCLFPIYLYIIDENFIDYYELIIINFSFQSKSDRKKVRIPEFPSQIRRRFRNLFLRSTDWKPTERQR